MTQNPHANPLLDQLRADRDAADLERENQLPDFVRHADRIGSHFALQVYTAGQLAAVLHAIGSHNRLNTAAAAELLGPLVGEAMEVSVAHWPGGPAITFQVPFFEHQRVDWRASGTGMGPKYSNDQRKAYAGRVIAAGRTLRADEISTRQYAGGDEGATRVVWGMTGTNPYEVRLWWD
jgi:hypothetical protein